MSDIEDSKKPALFLAPHAGGDRLSYSRLIKDLKADGDVFIYEMAGHGKRADETFSDSFEDIVLEFTQFIKDKAKNEKDYILCGVSMGAYLCDKVYERLKEEGFKLPGHVIYAAVDPGKPSGDLSISEIKEKSSNQELLNADNVYSRYLKGILEKDLELFVDGNTSFGTELQCGLSVFEGKEDLLLGKVDYDWSKLAPKGYREYIFEGPHLFMTTNQNVVSAIRTIRDKYA